MKERQVRQIGFVLAADTKRHVLGAVDRLRARECGLLASSLAAVIFKFNGVRDKGVTRD